MKVSAVRKTTREAEETSEKLVSSEDDREDDLPSHLSGPGIYLKLKNVSVQSWASETQDQ